MVNNDIASGHNPLAYLDHKLHPLVPEQGLRQLLAWLDTGITESEMQSRRSHWAKVVDPIHLPLDYSIVPGGFPSLARSIRRILQWCDEDITIFDYLNSTIYRPDTVELGPIIRQYRDRHVVWTSDVQSAKKCSEFLGELERKCI